jgi:1,4-dihydroxy-2-naphthoate octaprenyltransferase
VDAWRVWWRLARPFSLTASAVPVLVGTSVAVASGTFRAPDLFVAMLMASLLIQIATNMFNEYYDYKHGLDTPDTVGIAGAIVRGLVPAIDVFKAAIACFVIALALGLYIVTRTSWEVFVAGVASALGGYLYTGGPVPIAYTPFGELEVFVFMGPVIVGLAYFIQAGAVAPAAIWASLPVGCLVAAILLANNLRDVVADGRVGRRTVPVALGRRMGMAIFGGLLAGAFFIVAGAVATGALPATALLPLITLRTPVRLVRLYHSTEGPRALNAGVRGSAGLHARFGLLLALGISLGPLAGWRAPGL